MGVCNRKWTIKPVKILYGSTCTLVSFWCSLWRRRHHHSFVGTVPIQLF